jgi:flagellar assembly protein FliH
MSNLPFADFGESGGFQFDPRFLGEAAPQDQADPVDPVALAREEGYAAGHAEAALAALAEAEQAEAARAKITLSLARLDEQLAEELRQKLFATVELLCEAAIAPLALDKAALTTRVNKAAAMLARADDNRVLRLHPGDLALIAKNLPQDLEVIPDPTLDRGALRIESTAGGVEDGPEQWRRAITEALKLC